jgi:hypothetical protein
VKWQPSLFLFRFFKRPWLPFLTLQGYFCQSFNSNFLLYSFFAGRGKSRENNASARKKSNRAKQQTSSGPKQKQSHAPPPSQDSSSSDDTPLLALPAPPLPKPVRKPRSQPSLPGVVIGGKRKGEEESRQVVGKGKSVVVDSPVKKRRKPTPSEQTRADDWLEEKELEIRKKRAKGKNVVDLDPADDDGEGSDESEDVEESGSKELRAYSISQASTAPTGFVQRDVIPADEKFEIQGKKEVEEANAWLKESEKCYSFGRNTQFEIPVKNIIAPTATMCYRKMNKQHVLDLMKEMVENPGLTPAVAEVIAWSPYSNLPLSFQETQRAMFAAAIPELKFCAVSGQHSAQAVNNLLAKSQEIGGQHLLRIVEPLKIRKCRILNGNTPKAVLVELSLRNNAMNKMVSRFKSPFLDTIDHARNQYADLGCPPKPNWTEKGKKKKIDAFLDWEKVAQQTLERTHLNELNWILYASKGLYEKWREVCHAWMAGELLGPDGLDGKPHKMDQVTPKLFKCFEGDINEKTIKNIFAKVMNGTILLKKDVLNKSSILCMDDLAKASKFFTAIRPRIIKYLTEKYPTEFPKQITWGDIVKKLPELDDEVEMNRLKVIAGEQYAVSLTAKNKKELPFPTSLQSALNVFVAINLGITSRDRKVPFVVVKTQDLCETTEPADLMNDNPNCPFAIVDFGRRDTTLWTSAQLKFFFRWMATYTRCKVITIAIFVQPGALLARVLDSLYSIDGYTIHLEFGTYEGPENRWMNPNLVLADQREILLLVGLSSESKTDWASMYRNLKSLHFHYDAEFDKDFQSSFPSEDILAKETHEEKTTRLKEEYLEGLRQRAPRYDQGGVPGGWVNPESKARSAIRTLIFHLSSKDQTVFDFFSGGIVMKESLLYGRECIAFVDTPKECLFLETYPHMLRQLEFVEKFFNRVEKMARGEKVPEAKSTEDQGSGAVNVEGDIVLYKYQEDGDGGKSALALAALGILPPNDGAGPSRVGVESTTTNAYVRAELDAVFGKEGSEIHNAEQEQMDAILQQFQKLSPENMNEEVNVEPGEMQREVEPSSNQVVEQETNQVDEVGRGLPSTTGSSMMGEVNAIAGVNAIVTYTGRVTDEAGAHHPSSPNLSHFSSLSDNICNLLATKIPSQLNDMDSTSTTKMQFSHYVWADGSRKGEMLTEVHAKQLLGLKTFDKKSLLPIYVQVPIDVDRLNIQSILENNRLSEYGSFVKQ